MTEEEAELLESLEDEAANSKITLSFLLQLGEGCLGTAAVLRCLEMEDGGLYVILVSSEAGAGQGRVWLDVAVGGERLAVSGAGSICDSSVVIILVAFHLLLPLYDS